MITKFMIALISFHCSFYSDPTECQEHMEACIPIEQCEYPDYPEEGIIENCLESYEDWKFYFLSNETE